MTDQRSGQVRQPHVRLLMLEGPECAGKSSVFKLLKTRVVDDRTEFIHELPSYVGRRFPLGTGATADSELALMTMNGVLMEKFRDVVARRRRAVSDRCWISQTVYSRVRTRVIPGYSFDSRLFGRQEDVLFKLYDDVLSLVGVIYIDVLPEVSLSRLKRRAGKRKVRHSPNVAWAQAAYEEYQAYFAELSVSGRIPFREISGNGSLASVVSRLQEAAGELGFSLTVGNH